MLIGYTRTQSSLTQQVTQHLFLIGKISGSTDQNVHLDKSREGPKFTSIKCLVFITPVLSGISVAYREISRFQILLLPPRKQNPSFVCARLITTTFFAEFRNTSTLIAPPPHPQFPDESS